jgi:hypothetical protein
MMEVQGIMEILGYAKSLLPTGDIAVFMRQTDRIPIDFNGNWEMPVPDLVRILTAHNIDPDDIGEAYLAVYPVC